MGFNSGFKGLKDVKEVDYHINLLIAAKPITYTQFEMKSALCLKEYML